MTDDLEADLCAMLDWAEEEPSIYVIIITGKSGCTNPRSEPRLTFDTRQGREIVYSALGKI